MNDHINQFPESMIFWGGTGQAKVLRPIIEYFGSRLAAVFDDTPNLPPPFPDVDLYTGWEQFQVWIRKQDRRKVGFCIAIGNPHGRVRLCLQEKLTAEGIQPVTVVHPTAWVAKNAVIGTGCQIMAGAIVESEARIGQQCIVNTRASIDHECLIGDGVEVAPGATLCGLVKAGINAWICAGATILPRITIGADAIVGAGSVVIRDIPENVTVAGVPARIIKNRKEK